MKKLLLSLLFLCSVAQAYDKTFNNLTGDTVTASTITITSLSSGVVHIVAGSSSVVTALVSLSTEVTGTLPLANMVSSVTVAGTLVAGSNMTISPGVGVTTITFSGSGSGSSIYGATSTTLSPFGASFSTVTVTSTATFVGKVGISTGPVGIGVGPPSLYSLADQKVGVNFSTGGNVQIWNNSASGAVNNLTVTGTEIDFSTSAIALGRFGVGGVPLSNLTNDLTIKGTEGVFYTAVTTPTISSCGTSSVVFGTDVSGMVITGAVAGTCEINFASVHISTPACVPGWSGTFSLPPIMTTTPTKLKITLQGVDTLSGFWTYHCTDVRFQ